MAVSLQDANLVWQKVKIATTNANPAVQNAFAELKKWLAQQKGNPQLQYFAINAADIDTGADGAVILSGAGKLYGAYFKRVSDVDTTHSFIEVLDDATDNSAPTTDIVATLRLAGVANEEAFVVYPKGADLGTGIVVSATTTAGGTTESAATESANGFLIVGAA